MIRRLADADADAAAVLIRRAFAAQSVPTDPPASALRETADGVRAQLREGGGFAVDHAGALAGVLLWVPKDGGIYLGRLAVAPEARRRGVARALLEAAESEARRRAAPRLHLGTRIALADNHRLFEGFGFREVARHAHPGYAQPTWIEFEKRL